MKSASKNYTLKALLFFTIILSLHSCYLSELHLREYLRPVRKFFNQERSYWTDKIEYKGEAGLEIVYYKNGRPALERYFDEKGLLTQIVYVGRNGQPLRTDSLVYAGETLIGGYYFCEPEHQIKLRFLDYKRQGQLSQRSWFGELGELVSREFFLFDRNGDRRMRMIFDGHDSLLFSENFHRGSDQLEIQNTYSISGNLVSQIRYEQNQPTYQYDFNKTGIIKRISQLNDDGFPAWSSDLIYDRRGTIIRSNFSVNNQFLFTHIGDVELFQQSLRSWKHPASPGQIENIVKYNHTDPFTFETSESASGVRKKEYRLPRSGAVFKRSIFSIDGTPLSDTLYTNRDRFQPVSVINYDSLGQIDKEVSYDFNGTPRWLHTWIRDDNKRVIREELSALPDTFAAAVTRFYDVFNRPSFTERFASPDSFEGTWVFYHGGGISKTLFYDHATSLSESWAVRPGADTVGHSTFANIDYFRVESKYGLNDTLHSQLRFTNDGILNWELYFDPQGRIIKEMYRKKDGSIYREVAYNHTDRLIQSSTYAPVDANDLSIGDERKGEMTSIIETRLNESGETVQIVSGNSSGQTVWEKRNAYRGGRLLKSAQLDPDGKPVFISSYTHNEQGQVLTEISIDKLGDTVHTAENRYDEENQLIWRTFASNLTGSNSANRFYYNEEGRVERDEIIEFNRFIEAVEYTYFPEYFLRLAVHSAPDGKLLRKEVENYFGESVFNMALSKQE